MRVRRWKKPKAVITKTDEGTVEAGTYYIWGFISRDIGQVSVLYRHFAHSLVSDVYEVTVDGINETSIKVEFYVDGDIEVIDGDSNELVIFSEKHSLDAGDEIIIKNTNSYNGTYTITEWIDYDHFKVAGNFDEIETGEYECWVAHNTSNRINIHILDRNPFLNEFSDSYFLSSGNNNMWQFPITGNNNLEGNITHTPGPPNYGNIGRFRTCGADNALPSPEVRLIIKKYGVMLVEGDEESITDTDFNNMFLAAGIEDACWIGQHSFMGGGGRPFLCFGVHIDLPNWTRTYEYAYVKFIGMGNIPNITFYASFINTLGVYMGDTYNMTIGYGWRFLAIDCLMDSTRHTGQLEIETDGNCATISGIYKDGMDYKAVALASAWSAHDNYGHTRTMEGLSITGTHLRINNSGSNVPVGRNITFVNTSNHFDININNTTNQTNVPYFVNVNTAREDNAIIMTGHNTRLPIDLEFYRQKNIKVVDEFGLPIEGVLIKIKRDEYEWVCYTDENGIGETPLILEQKSINIGGGPATDDYEIYYDFTIEISGGGYEKTSTPIHIAREIPEFFVLKPTKTVRNDMQGNIYLAARPEKGSGSELLKI